jgi:hypothetical protein
MRDKGSHNQPIVTNDNNTIPVTLAKEMSSFIIVGAMNIENSKAKIPVVSLDSVGRIGVKS